MCGNHKIESPEECDDGNTNDDDECTNDCQVRCYAGEHKFGTHCYVDSTVQSLKKTWDPAESACNADGGHLVTITTMAEWEFVWNEVIKPTQKNELRWIGLNDKLVADDVYDWSSGEAVGETFWAPDEPGGVGQKCVAMNFDTGKWSTENCLTPARLFICEFAPPGEVQ